MPSEQSEIPTLYEVLGIAETASSEDIKGAFRRLAQQYHPDKIPEDIRDRVPTAVLHDAEQKFKEINEAYQVLGDPDKRRQYDEELRLFRQPQGPSSTAARAATPSSPPQSPPAGTPSGASQTQSGHAHHSGTTSAQAGPAAASQPPRPAPATSTVQPNSRNQGWAKVLGWVGGIGIFLVLLGWLTSSPARRHTNPNPSWAIGTVTPASAVRGWKDYVPQTIFNPGDTLWVYAEALNINYGGRSDVLFHFQISGPGQPAVERSEQFSRTTQDESCWAKESFQLPGDAQPGSYQIQVEVQNELTGQSESKGTNFTVDSPPIQPRIDAATPILPVASQTIAVRGSGFGTQASYNGDSSSIRITDLTRGWNAGNTGDAVTLNVSAWTDTQITIDGFMGAYNTGGWSLTTGDKVEIQIWNAQTGAGPAVITSNVAALSTPVSPVITSVTPILPQAVQTFSIKGLGFGVHASYDGDSPYILITDVTQGWNAGRTGDWVSLNVAQWKDDLITIKGFTGGYGSWVLRGGDKLLIRVWNAQTGTGPAAIRVTASLPARVQSPYSPPPASPPSVTWHTFSPEPRLAVIKIPSGTNMTVFSLDPISSKASRTGDIFRASLATPIRIDGSVVLQRGVNVYFRALEIRRGGHKGLSEIRLVLDHLNYEGRSYSIESSEYDFTNLSGKAIRVSPGAKINFRLLTPTFLPASRQ